MKTCHVEPIHSTPRRRRRTLSATLLWALIAILATSACNKPRNQTVSDDEPLSAPKAPPESTPPKQAVSATQNSMVNLEESAESPSPETPIEPVGDVTLRIFAPEGLEPVLRALGEAFTAKDSEVRTIEVLATGATENALAVPNLDMVVYPSWSDMEVLATAKLLAKRARTVTHLPVGIRVTGKSASDIREPSDLARPGIRVGIPPQKRDGGAARRLIRRASLEGKLTERTLPRGEASALRDETISAWIGFYPMQVGVPMQIPAHLREHQPVAAGILTQTEHMDASERFLDWLEDAVAQSIWTRFGTIPAVPNGLPITPTALPIKVRVPTHKASAVVIDERILLIGGRSSGKPVDRLAWVDVVNGRSDELATRLPEGREGASAIFHRENRRVLVFAGRGPVGPLNTGLRIDPIGETVERLDLILPDRRCDSTAIRVGQTVLLFGGRSESSILDTVIVVDLVASQASILQVRMPFPVASSAAVPGPDGKIWILGGESSLGEVSSIIEYSPDVGAFERHPASLPGPVMGHAATLFNEGVLVLGGRFRNKLRDTVDYVSFSGEAERISSRLLEPLGEPAAVSIGGKALVIGGLTKDRISNGIVRFPL